MLSSSVTAGGVCVTLTCRGSALDLNAVVLRCALAPAFLPLVAVPLVLATLADLVAGGESVSAARFLPVAVFEFEFQQPD